MRGGAGHDSCGGPGFFLLVAILVLAVVLGTAVLRLCQVAEPGSTSFLAVGLTSVIALLFLVDALFEWWMVIVIPLVSVATFLLSHWVTTTFVDTEPEVVSRRSPRSSTTTPLGRIRTARRRSARRSGWC